MTFDEKVERIARLLAEYSGRDPREWRLFKDGAITILGELADLFDHKPEDFT